MKLIGTLACILFAAPVLAQPGNTNALTQASIKWIKVADMCQNSMPYYSKQDIRNGMIVEVISAWRVDYDYAVAFADQAFAEYEKEKSRQPENIPTSLPEEFEGSNLLRMICHYDARHARRDVGIELKKQPPFRD